MTPTGLCASAIQILGILEANWLGESPAGAFPIRLIEKFSICEGKLLRGKSYIFRVGKVIFIGFKYLYLSGYKGYIFKVKKVTFIGLVCYNSGNGIYIFWAVY
jgi:hypothetical protein